jgi:DNA/RNA endonuclease G (NUC1)
LKYDEAGFTESEIQDAYDKWNNGNTHKLVPGYLTHPNDMIFKSWQKATHYHINTEPIYESIKDGNWKIVEDLVREKITKYKNAIIYTGVLDLEESENSILRVPKYFWKIVRVDKSGIAFITLNDPENDTDMKGYPGCNNICEESNWIFHNRTYHKMGNTICCNVDSFIKSRANNDVPHTLDARNILNGP